MRHTERLVHCVLDARDARTFGACCDRAMIKSKVRFDTLLREEVWWVIFQLIGGDIVQKSFVCGVDGCYVRASRIG